MPRLDFLHLSVDSAHVFLLRKCSVLKPTVKELARLLASPTSPSLSRYTLISEPRRPSFAQSSKPLQPPTLSSAKGLDSQLPPCARVVAEAEKANTLNGHGNLGFLSYQSGFMPLQQPLTAFPEQYSAWDHLVRNMPELIKTQTLRSAVEALPLLPTDAQSLPDIYLHRAASFLCIVALAYIRLDGDAPLELVGAGGERATHNIPAALETPWMQVSQRLGRERPFMSYIDLIVYNWQWKVPKSEANQVEFVLENLRLLIPTVDNREENNFYLTQVELLAQATPLIQNIVEAQRAVQQHDLDLLKGSLRSVTSTVVRLGQTTLAKVSSKPSSHTYTDPVVWTKSVASLAIPVRKDVRGPTGTGSPFFHMMDEFIARPGYNGHLGQESLELRRTYPPHWKAFLAAVGQVSVESFIKNAGDDECAKLWTALCENYQGQFGILGLHRRKVFAYLSTAFRIGRSTTIGGFKGKPSDEPWVKVHKELETARQERAGASTPRVGAMQSIETDTSSAASSDCRQVAVSEVLSHTEQSCGYWFSARGNVYDATSYRLIHPGGDKIILYSSGRDITFDLGVVQHLSTPSIRSKLDRLVIGNLQLCHFPNDPSLQQAYDFTVALGYKVAECRSIWTNDMTFLHSKMTSVDPDDQMTKQKARYFERAWKSLRTVYAPSVALHVAAVVDALMSLRQCSPCETLADLATRLKAINDQEFARSAFEVDMDSLTLPEACHMGESVSKLLYGNINAVVSAMKSFEQLPSSASKLQAEGLALIEAMQELTAALEKLGQYERT